MKWMQPDHLLYVARRYDKAFLELPELVGTDEQILSLETGGNHVEHEQLTEKVAMCLIIIDQIFPLPTAR